MKNNRVRLIAFVVIVALYAFLFACWMFHVPYNEAELFRAMPHNADMVSSHVDLPARFMRGATIADNFGFLSPKVLEARKAMAASREFRKIFAAPELRTKRSVVGYIHRLDGEPACFFATWLGRWPDHAIVPAVENPASPGSHEHRLRLSNLVFSIRRLQRSGSFIRVRGRNALGLHIAQSRRRPACA